MTKSVHRVGPKMCPAVRFCELGSPTTAYNAVPIVDTEICGTCCIY